MACNCDHEDEGQMAWNPEVPQYRYRYDGVKLGSDARVDMSEGGVDLLEKSIECLAYELNELGIKLSPVLGPDYADKVGSEPRPEMSRLGEARVRIDSLTGFVCTLRNRLEV